MPIPRKWLWIGAGGAGFVLALGLLLWLLPGKKAAPEENGQVRVSSDKQIKLGEKAPALSMQERLDSIRAGKFIKRATADYARMA